MLLSAHIFSSIVQGFPFGKHKAYKKTNFLQESLTKFYLFSRLFHAIGKFYSCRMKKIPSP